MMLSVMKLHLKFTKDEMYVVNSIEKKLKWNQTSEFNSFILEQNPVSTIFKTQKN